MSDNKVMVIIGANDSDFQAKMRGVEKGFQHVKDSVFSLQGALATLGITAVVSQSVQAMNQLERATVGLALSARYAGEDLQATTAAAKELTKDGLMSVAEASQALQLLLSRGYGLEKSIELMNRLKDSAAFNRQAHLEFGQSIVGAAEGLKNENSILVDNAGVTKNVSIMWKEYAAQLGKGADSLTQAEKRQAEYNGIMRETEGQVGNAERMTNSFQGAQARLNQELFNSKATLGQALVPALGDVLTTLRPVISGIRDMVLWVETLGARAGATYDKLALRAELALSGKGIFSKEGLAEYARRVKIIDQALDETIADVVNRSEGGVPDLGKDTGTRRKDTIIPPKKGETAKEKAGKSAAASALKEYEQGLSAYSRLVDTLISGVPELSGLEKALAKVNDQVYELSKAHPEQAEAAQLLGEEIKKQLEVAEAQKLANVERRESILLMEEMNGGWGLKGLDSGLQTPALQMPKVGGSLAKDGSSTGGMPSFSLTGAQETTGIMGNPTSRGLTARETQDEADKKAVMLQIEKEYIAELAYLRGDSSAIEMLRIQQDEDYQIESWAKQAGSFEAQQQRMGIIAAISAEKRAALTKAEEEKKRSIAQEGFSSAASLADAFYQRSGEKSKSAFRAYQAAKSGETVVATASSAMKSFDKGAEAGGPWLGAAFAAVAIAAGAVQLANIWDANDSGSRQIGSSGSSYGSGGNSSSSSVVTQPTYPQTQQQGSMTIVFQGNVMDTKYIEEQVIPKINDAGSRNIKIEYLN